MSALTAQNSQINFSFKFRKTYSDASKQSVPATILFSFKEDNFPRLTNVFQPVSKSVTAGSIVVSSNVSGHVKRFLSI